MLKEKNRGKKKDKSLSFRGFIVTKALYSHIMHIIGLSKHKRISEPSPEDHTTSFLEKLVGYRVPFESTSLKHADHCEIS